MYNSESGNFMEEIEERLRARAGNPGYNKVYNKFEGEEKINSAKT